MEQNVFNNTEEADAHFEIRKEYQYSRISELYNKWENSRKRIHELAESNLSEENKKFFSDN